MKLSREYLGIEFEEGSIMKNFYLQEQTKIFHKNSLVFDDEEYKGHLFQDDEYSNKEEYVAKALKFVKKLNAPTNRNNIFYLSQAVQDHAKLIDFDKINLDWFKSFDNELSTFIINKNEFYRFNVVKGSRINIVYWAKYNDGIENRVKYESYAILLDEKKIVEYPDQDENQKQQFVKLLLFVKLSDPEIIYIGPSQKLKKDIGLAGGENKILNDTKYNVTLVNTLWNKTKVIFGQTVRGHIRIQPYGPQKSLFKPIWIEEYKKGLDRIKL